MPKVLQIYAGPAARNAPRKPPGNVLRLVCMSDTHTTVERRCVQAPETLGEWVPQGDVFLHAGDFSNTGKLSEVKLFESFLRMLPHPYKIVIAGNHEISFDPSCRLRMYGNAEQMAAQVKAMVCHPSEGIHYLEDSAVTLAGLCFYGSPHQPEFGGWGFNVERGPEIKRKWDLIPDNVDVLLTHGPPRGHGGRAKSGVDAGCADLLDACARVKPLVHVFGHIHEDYGVSEDAHTKYINASTCTIRYEPRNPAVIVDVQV